MHGCGDCLAVRERLAYRKMKMTAAHVMRHKEACSP